MVFYILCVILNRLLQVFPNSYHMKLICAWFFDAPHTQKLRMVHRTLDKASSYDDNKQYALHDYFEEYFFCCNNKIISCFNKPIECDTSINII